MAAASMIDTNKPSLGFEAQLLEIKALTLTEPRVALQQLDQFEVSHPAAYKTNKFEISLLKGMCFLQLSDLEDAEKQFDFCLDLAEASENTLDKVKAQNYRIQVLFRQNKLQQVLITGNETLSLAKEIDAFTEQALAHNSIGIAYGTLYAYEDSLKALLSGLELKEHLDKELIYKLNNNTSNVYFFLGHYEQALDTLKEATFHINIEENPRVHILSEMNFGKIYTKLEKIDTATKHLEKAKLIAEQHPEHSDLFTGIYENLAELYVAQNLNDKATGYFQKAIKLAQEANRKSYSANVLVSLAKCYLAQGNIELSLNALNSAVELSEKDLTRLNIHKTYSELYEQLGEYKTALEHYKRYHDLKEDVQNERSQSRIQGMMIKNDTERVQNENKRIAFEQELASLRLMKLEQDNKKLVEENTRDGLTNAYNRRFLNEKLETLYGVAKKNQSPLSVLMSDIDFFKQVNDTFSHAVGDEVLRAIAIIFMENTRHLDIVARYGGEEFVVILDRTHKTTAITIAEKLRKLVESYPWHEIHPDLKITISTGIASGTAFNDYEALLNHADKYMYSAKRSGKNQVQYE